MEEGFLETVYDVLFHPGTAMRNIAAQKMAGWAVVVFVISLLVPAWTIYLVLKAAGLGKMAGITIVLQSGGHIVLWLLGTALFHLSAECLGGRGTALGLLSTMGFAHLPRLFLVPLFVLAFLATGGMPKFLLAMFSVIIAVWVLALDIQAIRGTYELSALRAFAVMLVPFFLMFIVAILVVFAIGLSIY